MPIQFHGESSDLSKVRASALIGSLTYLNAHAHIFPYLHFEKRGQLTHNSWALHEAVIISSVRPSNRITNFRIVFAYFKCKLLLFAHNYIHS